MIASRPTKKATMARALTRLPFLDDLDRSLARPMVRALDAHDRDDRGGVVLIDHRLHDLDDPRQCDLPFQEGHDRDLVRGVQDRKSTRLNSSHRTTSYAVFCLKKKKTNNLKMVIYYRKYQENSYVKKLKKQ